MEDYEIRHMEYAPQSYAGLKIRFFLAMVLFVCFIFCKYTSYEIFEYNTMEIIDMISDNQYYTILQKYVKL